MTATGGGAERWLSLAAAPTFAAMAVATAWPGLGPPDGICTAAPHASPWTGMAAMYALMSAFHSAPWWRRVGRHRRAEAMPLDRSP